MHQWKGLNIEAEGCGISKPLSYQVNLLGSLLGHAIREQAGEDIFSLVEQFRLLCKNEYEDNLNYLQQMYDSWTFFRTIIDNAQLEMARAKLDIARHYSDLSEQCFHKEIEADFNQALGAILKITNQARLLDNQSAIQKSIMLRNPYTDVLNLLQIELLARCRKSVEFECKTNENVLLLSINGIAAAMQSTG